MGSALVGPAIRSIVHFAGIRVRRQLKRTNFNVRKSSIYTSCDGFLDFDFNNWIDRFWQFPLKAKDSQMMYSCNGVGLFAFASPTSPNAAFPCFAAGHAACRYRKMKPRIGTEIQKKSARQGCERKRERMVWGTLSGTCHAPTTHGTLPRSAVSAPTPQNGP